MVDASEDGAFALETNRGAKETTDGQQAARSANADIERIILVLGLCAVGRRRPQVSQPEVHLVVEGSSFQLQLDAKLNQHPSPPVANPTTSLSTISKITATWVTARTDKRIKRLDWDGTSTQRDEGTETEATGGRGQGKRGTSSYITTQDGSCCQYGESSEENTSPSRVWYFVLRECAVGFCTDVPLHYSTYPSFSPTTHVQCPHAPYNIQDCLKLLPYALAFVGFIILVFAIWVHSIPPKMVSEITLDPSSINAEPISQSFEDRMAAKMANAAASGGSEEAKQEPDVVNLDGDSL